jgi:ribose transport system permease protein
MMQANKSFENNAPNGLLAFKQLVVNNSVITAILVLIVIMSVFVPSFATVGNLNNVILQLAVIGIPAVGLTFVLLGAGIDLSIGSVLSLSSLAGAMIMVKMGSAGGALGIITIIVIGIGIGLINGLLIVKLGMNPFMMTLTSQFLLQGIAFAMSKATSIGGFPDWYTFIGRGTLLNIPFPIWIMVAFFAVGHYVTKYTGYGRMLYATGANKEAARIAGLPVTKILISTYVLSGFCAAVAGIIMSSQLGTAAPGMGGFILLDIISAVIIGGTSFFGGKGSVAGTAFGVLLIGLISNGINLLGVNYYMTMIIKGLTIFIAVALDVIKERNAKHTSG